MTRLRAQAEQRLELLGHRGAAVLVVRILLERRLQCGQRLLVGAARGGIAGDEISSAR